MKFSMDDIKRELKAPQDEQQVSIQAINEQILTTISGLESKSILERNAAIYKSMVGYLAETKLNCRKKGLFLFGGTGTGKTFSVKVIASFRDLHLYTCKHLEKVYEDSTEAFWQIIKERKVIIIDDLGTEKESNNYGVKSEIMEDALYERHRLFEQHGIRTIITTNLNKEAIIKKYDERIYSRLRQMCECINAVGEDLRL